MIDSRLKLRHVLTFLEVAHVKSVGRAAAALSVTQPAVSKTLRELEEVLGAALFDRSRRTLHLTPLGEAFLRHAGAGVAALRQGIETVKNDGGGPVARVGILPTASAGIMPEAMRMLKSSGFPATVRIVTGANDVLMEQLRHGALDLVVGRFSGPMTGLAFEQLYSEPLVLAARPGHPLSRPDAFDLRRLPDFVVLMPPPGSVIRPTVDAFLAAGGVGAIPDQIETVSMAFGRQFTRTTDAVWIISSGVVADDLMDGLLIALPADMRDTRGPVGLTTRAGIEEPNPAIAVIAQAIRSVAARRAGG